MKRAARSTRGRSRTIARAGCATLAAGCALALAACSSPGPAVMAAADPVAAVRQAGLTTTHIGTAAVATTVTMTTDGKSEQFSGTGGYDFGRQIGSITLIVPPEVNAHGTLDEIVTPTTLYMRDTGSSAKWVRVDSTKLADGDLISAGYTSPVLAFAMLQGAGAAGGSVKYVGQDKVYNTPVAHYSGTLDLTAAAAAASAPLNSALAAASRSFSKRAVPFDVYLDSAGRVRRFVAHFQFAASAGHKGVVAIVSAVDLYDIGKPVTVAAPASADATEAG